ncbi:MAG: discoidin domain-containing protein [Bacteroidales bacterium]|nr:discoidin domain-containing protein [Bacteroidales bacterium]
MRRKWIFLTLLLIQVMLVYGQQKSTKRGICGDASPEDLAAFAPYISWYYDWGVEPPALSQGQLSGIEWVPMQWGGINAGQVENIKSRIPEGSVYFLGFNEPNFKSQANLTPAQAADMWPYIEQIANDKGLIVVSPAVNWCGDCVDGVTSDPVDWLDKFIAECPECHFDYIAIHNYNSFVSTLEWYVGKFKKYGKKIWLTEFASWDDPVDYAGVVEYMKESIPYLEQDTNIFRYSWFATRVGSNPDLDLLGANGKLTKLGKLYATMPFEGSTIDNSEPIAFLPERISINLPANSQKLPGNTYYPVEGEINIEWSQISGPNTATFSSSSVAQPTVSGLIFGEYVFQLKASANGKSDSAQIILSVGQANIAKGKTATSSSNQDGNPASNAFDGKLTTRWSSLDSDPQWLQIDLNASYDITGAKIAWEAAFAKVYTIDVSSDGTNWTTVYSTSNGPGGTETFTFEATGRYIRMHSTRRNNQSQWWGNSIWEFEVYGNRSTGTEELNDDNAIAIYPVPATDFITIGNLPEDCQISVSIYDYTGRMLIHEGIDKSAQEFTFDIGNFEQGLYILAITTDDKTLSKTIIKH